MPSPLVQKLWALARQIPPGRVTTYGLLAVAAGAHPRMAQMVSHLLSRAPDADKLPWHRIVYSNGHVWLDDNCKNQRLKLYRKENIKLDKNLRIIDFDKLVYPFPIR